MEADENTSSAGDNGDLMAPRSDSADGSESTPGPGKRAAQNAGGCAGQGGSGGGGQSQGSGGAGGGGQGAKQYSCPHCSYSADKKVSLNR